MNRYAEDDKILRVPTAEPQKPTVEDQSKLLIKSFGDLLESLAFVGKGLVNWMAWRKGLVVTKTEQSRMNKMNIEVY